MYLIEMDDMPGLVMCAAKPTQLGYTQEKFKQPVKTGACYLRQPWASIGSVRQAAAMDSCMVLWADL